MHFYHGKITSCIPLPSTGTQLCANFCPQTALSLPLIEYSMRMRLELKCGSLKNFVPGLSVFFLKKRCHYLLPNSLFQRALFAYNR